MSVGRETSPTGNSDEMLYRDSSAYTIGMGLQEKPTSLRNFEQNYLSTEFKSKVDDKKLTKMRKIMGNMPRSGKSVSVLHKPDRQSAENLDLTSE